MSKNLKRMDPSCYPGILRVGPAGKLSRAANKISSIKMRGNLSDRRSSHFSPAA